MVRRSTWIILILFVVVIGFAILVEKTPYFQPSSTPTATSAPKVLKISSGGIIAVNMAVSQGQSISVRLDSQNNWVADLPANAKPDQGNMAELSSDITALQVMGTVSSPPPPASATGLQAPAQTLTITDNLNHIYVLKIGNATPTSSGYYVQLDQNNPVIADKTSIDRIVQLLTDVAATPTPLPTTSPAVTNTPQPTASPSPTP